MLSPEKIRDILYQTDMHIHVGIELPIPLADFLEYLKNKDLVNIGLLDHFEMYYTPTRPWQFTKYLDKRRNRLPYKPTLKGLKDFYRRIQQVKKESHDFKVFVGLECQAPNLDRIPAWIFEQIELLGCCYHDTNLSISWAKNVIPVVKKLSELKRRYKIPIVNLHHPLRTRLIDYRDSFSETGKIKSINKIFGYSSLNEVASYLKGKEVFFEMNGHTCFHYLKNFSAGQNLFFEVHQALATKGVDFSIGSDAHSIEGEKNPLRHFVDHFYPHYMHNFSRLIKLREFKVPV